MQYPGKAPPPFVEPHRLQPGDSPRAPGLAPIDAATLAALHDIGRRPPPRERVLRILAMVAAIVLHIGLVLLVRYEMEPRLLIGYAPVADREDVLEVRFIEPAPRPAPAVETPPPPPEPPPKVRSPEATRPEPPRPRPSTQATPQPPAPDATPAPDAQARRPVLFGADGSIVMPKKGAEGTTQADFVARKPTDDSGIMSHKTTVTYTQTRFEKDWAPRDENALNKGLRRAMETTTVKKTIDLGHGVRVKCATVFFVLPVGCGGEDPSKAAAKDGDVRLNMAPANPPVKDLPGQPAPPTEAECIAAFRADKPLPQGCASDTPLKAMDQENAERERRTGK
ncbi:hypothetical protein HBF26_11415 [Luteibacter jiangsuensis]|uniref:Protein TonB n=1 Tax=Luteibacter jiangsuensis TaxID=637577 RepID=A0ABX0Q520_9GAMM|nr:hypothetical protein [Luteibacter jiangsuensis]NID05497.1 hypothetical protein [Luteibacter jiangsuensis]